jgi:hypothetical protein
MTNHKVGQWYQQKIANKPLSPFLIIKKGFDQGMEFEGVLIAYNDEIVKSSWYSQGIDAPITKPYINPKLYRSVIEKIWKYI